MSDEPRIVLTKNGECYFEQGDIKFHVDPDNLSKVVGTCEFSEEGSVLDKLMDSAIATLARANNLPITPYIRKLVREPLIGIIQLVWYRDLHNHKSEYLEQNQAKRVQRYIKRLAEYRADPSKVEAESEKKPDRWTRAFHVMRGKHQLRKGRETQVFEIIKELKEATFAQIVEAAKTRLQTKSRLEYVVGHFVNTLTAAGAIEVVQPNTGEHNAERGSGNDNSSRGGSTARGKRTRHSPAGSGSAGAQEAVAQKEGSASGEKGRGAEGESEEGTEAEEGEEG